MPRVTTADSESFRDVWGYCAIIGARELMWSGYRIPDPASQPDLDTFLAGLRQGLSLESPRSRQIFTDGAVCWLANELVETTYHDVNGSPGVVCEDDVELMAAALSRIAGRRFFVVLLERNRAKQALRATVEAVEVSSPEDARDYILHHPRVLALEAEGLRRLQDSEPATAQERQAALFTCERLHGLAN